MSQVVLTATRNEALGIYMADNLERYLIEITAGPASRPATASSSAVECSVAPAPRYHRTQSLHVQPCWLAVCNYLNPEEMQARAMAYRAIVFF